MLMQAEVTDSTRIPNGETPHGVWYGGLTMKPLRFLHLSYAYNPTLPRTAKNFTQTSDKNITSDGVLQITDFLKKRLTFSSN